MQRNWLLDKGTRHIAGFRTLGDELSPEKKCIVEIH